MEKENTLSEIEIVSSEEDFEKKFEKSAIVADVSVFSSKEKILAHKEKCKALDPSFAPEHEPVLYSAEEQRANAVIHSDSMFKGEKRVASFLRVKT